MKKQSCGGLRVWMLLWTVGLVMAPLAAAEFWEKKDYQQWTEKDCTKLLTNSPWAHSNSFRRNANIGSTFTGERETTEIIYFRVLSARPVRMALARLQLLERPDDEALRQQVEAFLASPQGDQIVIQISYKGIPGTTPQLHELHRFFGQATLAAFHGNTTLSSKEVTVPIREYLPWGPDRPNAAFVFPRYDESGKPYFDGSEDSITLRSEFEVPMTDGTREYAIHVKMKPKEMVFQQEFAF